MQCCYIAMYICNPICVGILARVPESASNSREEQLGNPVVSRALQSKTQLKKSQLEGQTLLTIIRICLPRLRDSVTALSTQQHFED